MFGMDSRTIVRLKMCDNGIAMIGADSLRKYGSSLSSPGDLLTLSVRRALRTVAGRI